MDHHTTSRSSRKRIRESDSKSDCELESLATRLKLLRVARISEYAFPDTESGSERHLPESDSEDDSKSQSATAESESESTELLDELADNINTLLLHMENGGDGGFKRTTRNRLDKSLRSSPKQKTLAWRSDGILSSAAWFAIT